MDHPAVVDVRQGPGQFRADVRGVGCCHLPRTEPLAQVRALHQFHDQEGMWFSGGAVVASGVVLAGVEKGNQSRMGQRGQQPHLGLLPPDVVGRHSAGAEKLDGDVPAQGLILALVDRGHTTVTDRFDETVTPGNESVRATR